MTPAATRPSASASGRVRWGERIASRGGQTGSGRWKPVSTCSAARRGRVRISVSRRRKSSSRFRAEQRNTQAWSARYSGSTPAAVQAASNSCRVQPSAEKIRVSRVGSVSPSGKRKPQPAARLRRAATRAAVSPTSRRRVPSYRLGSRVSIESITR